MKKIFSFAAAMVCIFSSVTVMAGDPLFLSKPGMEAEYVIKDGKGNVLSYVKNIVTDVNTTDAQNMVITQTVEVFDKDKKSQAAPIETTTEVADGAIVMDPSASMAGMNAKFEGTYPSFPSDLSVGQSFDYSYTMKMGISKTTTSGKNTVVSKESVSTAAGSFDCFKVESEMEMKVMRNTTKTTSMAWYAEGVGAVKTETYDAKGNIETLMELISLKR